MRGVGFSCLNELQNGFRGHRRTPIWCAEKMPSRAPPKCTRRAGGHPSLPKKRPSHPMRTPDLSKLVRSTEGAITSAGLWRDDARVVECTAAKTYPAHVMGAHPEALPAPGCRITIELYP